MKLTIRGENRTYGKAYLNRRDWTEADFDVWKAEAEEWLDTIAAPLIENAITKLGSKVLAISSDGCKFMIVGKDFDFSVDAFYRTITLTRKSDRKIFTLSGNAPYPKATIKAQ